MMMMMLKLLNPRSMPLLCKSLGHKEAQRDVQSICEQNNCKVCEWTLKRGPTIGWTITCSNFALDTRFSVEVKTSSTLIFPCNIKMSDFEDEMEIDPPAAPNSVLFNSDNTNVKGKRSAANLPVEAEDSLPW